MTTDRPVKYYSQRMLNPFHGIVNAVEIAGADAVSRDGLHWSLYVQHVDEDGAHYPDIKFGDWSEVDGLKRYPIRYIADYSALDRKGEKLLQTIRALQDELPFPAADCYELWLMDKARLQPMALVGSACGQPENPLQSVSWRAGVTARKSFESNDICESLEALINDQAAAKAQWLLRDGEGAGVVVGTGQTLPVKAFPDLMIRPCWTADRDESLVAAYLRWQAPWLLELQSLGEDIRQQLEIQAVRRAQLVNDRYRNYPQITNRKALNAALVEARLRDAADTGNDGQEDEVIDFFQSGN